MVLLCDFAAMHKNRLQEFTQRSGMSFPVFETVNEGQSHAPQFRSTVWVNGMSFTSQLTFFQYIQFKHETEKKENKGVLEVSTVTFEEWKNMTEEQKRPYEEMAQKKEEEAANPVMEEEEHMKLQKHETLQLLKKN
uniref:High mobility group B protein 13-like n=1 Tax=Cicer arietinum TaxID=3827 RepID=A0A1S3E072_CICAR|nr:high mobility group B protein 13-like [Cicer arietinum]